MSINLNYQTQDFLVLWHQHQLENLDKKLPCTKSSQNFILREGLFYLNNLKLSDTPSFVGDIFQLTSFFFYCLQMSSLANVCLDEGQPWQRSATPKKCFQNLIVEEGLFYIDAKFQKINFPQVPLCSDPNNIGPGLVYKNFQPLSCGFQKGIKVCHCLVG